MQSKDVRGWKKWGGAWDCQLPLIGLGHVLIFGPITVYQENFLLKEALSLRTKVGMERCPMGWQEARETGMEGRDRTLGP